MIQIYSKDKTNFQQNGDSTLIPIECTIEAKLNGAWELQMEHPLDEEGKYRHIETGAVIAAPSFVSEKQLFRIYNTEKTDSSVMAYARPIFLDAQEECFLLNVRPTNKDGQGALDVLTAGSKYSAVSNIKGKHTANYVRKNLIEAIAGAEKNAFLNLWGGEVLYDNYKIIVNEQIGADNGVQAKFGRNILGIAANVNMDGVITRIVPVAFNGYMLEGNEPWVDSPLIDSYTHPYIQEVRFGDVKLQEDCDEGEEGFADLASLRAELIRQCNLMYENGYDKPACNYSISLVDLSQTEEYKDYVALEAISLGDFIKCEYEPLDVATKARVIQLTYDCIRKCNSAVELGDFTYDYFAESRKKTAQINSVIDENGNLIAERVQGVLDALTTQFKYQKTVAKKQDVRAILFEDTDPNSEMYGALSIGTQGFQIANKMLADGSDWEWSTAFTANGGYADAIVTGILTDKLGKTFWNLDTGELVLSGGADIGGLSVQEIVDAAESASKAENAVASVNVQYALGNNTTTAPTSGWSNTAPTWTEGKYMWQKTVTVYVNGTVEESTPTCISGATGQAGADGKDGKDGANGADGAKGEKGDKGDKGDTGATGATGAQGEKGDKGDTGAQGATGAQGIGIKSIVEQYYLSPSSTTQTGGSWSTEQPTWKPNFHIWTRSYITWTDGTTSTTTPVLANALNSVSQSAATTSAIISDWCYNNDTTYINGGKVYAPELFSKTITVTGTGWVYPTQEDVNLVKSLMTGSPTAAQIALYDFNGDGKISITDFTICNALVLGKVTIDDYPNYKKQMSTITVTIDASNPDKIIRMTGTSSFGRELDFSLGLNGFKGTSMACEGVSTKSLEVSGGTSVGDLTVGGKLTTDGVVNANNYIILKNGYGLYSLNTSGAMQELATMTTGDNIVLGGGETTLLRVGHSSKTQKAQIYSKGAIDFLCGGASATTSPAITMESSSGIVTMRPTVNSKLNLGSSSYKLGNIYCGLLESSGAVISNNASLLGLTTDGKMLSIAKVTDGNDIHLAYGYNANSNVKVGDPSCTTRMQLFSKGRIDFFPLGVTDANKPALSIWGSSDSSGAPCFRGTSTTTLPWLGNSTYRFGYIYSQTSVNVSSDRRLKTDVKDLDERYIKFAELLMPKSFYSIYDDEETKKRRIGYVAQEVEEAALEAGLALEDCNFLHKDWVKREDYTGWEYSLNYDDIAVIVHGKVRQQEERINALENEVAELKELVSKLIAQ